MKKVYLVRHGKAVAQVAGLSDFERVLAETGIHDMETMSKTMKKLGICPEVIISSPAPRALQTARIVAKELGYPLKKIKTRTSLYDQSEDAIHEIITSLEESINSVMIVGHNPLISEYAWFVSKKFRKELPTSGLAVIESKVDTWAEIQQGKGKCVCFDAPGIKDKSGLEKMLRSALKTSITDQLVQTLNYYDPSSEKTLKKVIKDSAEAISKAYIKKISRKIS